MKELSIEQKAKAYDEALERAIKHRDNDGLTLEQYETIDIIFPELKESEGELKWLTKYIEEEAYSLSMDIRDNEDRIKLKNLQKALAWLERQGEHTIACSEEQMKVLDEVLNFAANHESSYWNDYIFETLSNLIRQLKHKVMKKSKIGNYVVDDCGYLWNIDKVEPKFKVGNWYLCIKDFFGKGVTFDKNTTYYCAKEGCLQNEYGCHIAIVNELYDNFKLWDISDAKDGDILAGGDWVFIFKKFHINGFPKCHCHYDMTLEEFKVDTDSYMACGRDIYPATKEQRNLLFAKMEESNYKWDANKKKLSKIEQKNDILTDFEYSLKHIMEEAIECGDTHNLKADADMLIRLAQKPTAWSEEDEHRIKDIIYFLDTAKKHYASTVELDACIEWLKLLKERIENITYFEKQNNEIWTDNDYDKVKSIEYLLHELDNHNFDNWFKLRNKYDTRRKSKSL